jgi:adenylosuccinate synthase
MPAVVSRQSRRVGAPVHIISTGPDRHENIIRQYPFD